MFMHGECINQYISLNSQASEWENRAHRSAWSDEQRNQSSGCATLSCLLPPSMVHGPLFKASISVSWTFKGMYFIILLLTLLFRSVLHIW